MEEPEIALPPHTQRRIIEYLLNHTSQCFVTSHSPYVIERFSPEQIFVIRRGTGGEVQGKRVQLPAGVKPTTYRMMLRRAIAEAMLGKAVIVAEGRTEQLALRAAADILEGDGIRQALDISGTAIVHCGGDGNIGELGLFFKDLGLRTFAFYDLRRTRTAAETARIAGAFDVNCQTPYTGSERLLATEVPLDRQWQFLESVRQEDTDGRYGLPAVRPNDDEVREATFKLLQKTKGDGMAAALIGLCTAAELPPTISTFLDQVYTATTPAAPPVEPAVEVAPDGVVTTADPET